MNRDKLVTVVTGKLLQLLSKHALQLAIHVHVYLSQV